MLDSINSAIEDIKKGKLVIVVDDENRENEGDFIGSSEMVTPEMINFMSTYGRGLICVSLEEERCQQLDLKLMVEDNTVLHQTQFTVSIDLIGNGCTTGISAQDRAKTIKALTQEKTKSIDFGRPGHIFPLRAKKGGVLRRAGHTEATVDLMKLSGHYPSGVLVEIMNEDGTMARLPELKKIAKKFNLKIISIQDLIAFKLKNESQIIEKEVIKMPTKHGIFDMHLFEQKLTGDLHIALIKGSITPDKETLVRVHSSCVTGDILHSLRCDCGEQLEAAMKKVEKKKSGVILYMNQEGRGIGLLNKIRAYKLQEKGYDTVEANLKLGFKMDERDYGIGAQILKAIGVTKINLITNNPKKRIGLSAYGLEIVNTTTIRIPSNPYNENYLKTKAKKMGHVL